jgi:hypothetical protein
MASAQNEMSAADEKRLLAVGERLSAVGYELPDPAALVAVMSSHRRSRMTIAEIADVVGPVSSEVYPARHRMVKDAAE